MLKDSAQTKERILAAAVEEFSAFGLAGSRIDRIADAARSNKAMIYRYFGNKEQLFDAVFDAMVVATVDAVPLDVADLPGYAAALHEQHRREPRTLRIATWDRLERDGAGTRLPTVREATDDKIAQIRAAQARGQLTAAYSAEAILKLVIALSQPALGPSSEEPDGSGWVATAVRAALGEPAGSPLPTG
ncbi:TetR family transcriptional regulator [Paractinoplanes lichenicola]|uniref:TetR family transcriptional regulator n=1 Tax=Paractinoplanes lichenicola TaxID=2802976 RepID=A0ABS1VM99_9ACTN|nr:TetR family transcriptional regulator [Actinoplanes lichenicola]MBL7255849.1 TetR family transcriptional regulator [Actinoplanes lichenicola]